MKDLAWTTNSKEFTLHILAIEENNTITSPGDCWFQIKGALEEKPYNNPYSYIHEKLSVLNVKHMAALAPMFEWHMREAIKYANINDYSWTPFTTTYAYLGFDDYYEAPFAHLFSVYNVTSSWNDAEQDCIEGGGHMFTLDSPEQWHILMENHEIINHLNHELWLAPFIFLGRPNTRKVLFKCYIFKSVCFYFSIFIMKPTGKYLCTFKYIYLKFWFC